MRINVKVLPNSGRQEIIKINDTEYKVFLKKSPENNKANEELTKVLGKYLEGNIKIIKGKTSKKKLIEYEPKRNVCRY